MEEKLASEITCFTTSFAKFVTAEYKRHGNPNLTSLLSFSFLIKSTDTQQIPRIIEIPQPGEYS